MGLLAKSMCYYYSFYVRCKTHYFWYSGTTNSTLNYQCWYLLEILLFPSFLSCHDITNYNIPSHSMHDGRGGKHMIHQEKLCILTSESCGELYIPPSPVLYHPSQVYDTSSPKNANQLQCQSSLPHNYSSVSQ